jgi:hypothetical protein
VSADGLVHTLAFAPDETPTPQLISRIVSSLPVADLSLEEPGIGAVVRQLHLGDTAADASP